MCPCSTSMVTWVHYELFIVEWGVPYFWLIGKIVSNEISQYVNT